MINRHWLIFDAGNAGVYQGLYHNRHTPQEKWHEHEHHGHERIMDWTKYIVLYISPTSPKDRPRSKIPIFATRCTADGSGGVLVGLYLSVKNEKKKEKKEKEKKEKNMKKGGKKGIESTIR